MFNGRNVTGGSVLLAFVFVILVNSTASGSELPLWGKMSPGPHAIGFKTVELYDYSRLIVPKSDYFGNPIPGNKARPMQICIWYPAQASDDATMVFGEYSFPMPDDDELFGFVSEMQNREIQYLQRRMMGGPEVMLRINNLQMAAIRDAPRAEGSFPLIVYESDRGMGIAENVTILEFLASHGYIVVTTHSTGAASLNPEENYRDMESLIRDKQFLIGYMHDYPHANLTNIGAIGCGFGGLSALSLAARMTGVEAAVLLGDYPTTRAGYDFLAGNLVSDITRYNKSVLLLSSTLSDNKSLLFENLTYSNRHMLSTDSDQVSCFSLYDAALVLISDADQAAQDAIVERYNAVCMGVQTFFDATLKGKADAFESFVGATDYLYYSAKAEELPPNSVQFSGILMSGDVALAVELSQKFSLCDPDNPIIAEALARDLGYRFLRQGRNDDAIEIFKMYTLLYPSHANAWDCLAETYAHVGDTAAAIKNYQTSLAKLPGDDSITDDFRDRLREGATSAIEGLQKP